MKIFFNILKIIILLAIGLLKSKAQVYQRPDIDLKAFIEKMALNRTQDLDYEKMFENLYSFYQNPIDLNKAENNELRSLYLLSEIQINSILKHREIMGDFLSIYELQSVENLDLETIKTILPYVTVKQKFELSNYKTILNKTTEHYLVLRASQTLQKAEGFNENKYIGSRNGYYFRYRLSHSKDFNIGFISEKDPGEKRFLDYSNFHIQALNKGIFKNIVVGDYLMQFGQGLIFSAGFAPGKGSEPIYFTRRSNLGIRPYNSVTENASFRGISNTISYKNFEITSMISSTKRDAVVPDSNNNFSTLISNGFHRTLNEINNKNTINEHNFGANVLYRLSNLEIGFSGLTTLYNKTYTRRPEAYNYFEFTGKHNFVAGPNISVNLENFNVFAEAARSSSGGMAVIAGVVAALSNNLEWALNFRNYQKNFHSPYANAFSEGSRTINEKGTYMGLKYSLNKKLILAGFFDTFKFPWLKYRIDAPSYGFDYQLRINYSPSKTCNSFVNFHHESKQINQTITGILTHQLAETKRNNIMIGNDILFRRIFKIQSKIQLNSFQIGNNKKSIGYAIIEDFEKKLSKIQWNTRIAYFKTDNWDSRIYAYENDVQFAVAFPAYYGNGIRLYLNAKLPLNNKTSLSFRASNTKMLNQNNIGSGYDLIKNTNKTDIKVQLKYDL